MKKRKFILRILLIVIFLLPIAFFAFRRARTHYVVSGYFKEPRWHELKNIYASYKKKGPLTILFGNSITENFRFFLPESDSLFNMGISGDFTEGLIQRIDDVTALKPEKLFIKIGINDIVERVPIAEIKRNYITVLDQIRTASPNTAIYIQSTLPTRNLKSLFRDSKDINKIVMKLNAFLKEKAKERNLVFIDMYPDFVDENNLLREQLTTDGIHLNEAGYAIWKSHLSKYISI